MDKIKQEQKRIEKLVQQDNNNADKIAGFYSQAMTIVSNNLNEFFFHYAVDNHLSVGQVSKDVSTWDVQQFHLSIH
ncbi:hypothetical protein IV37_GL000178 [Fructilactobacillus fructivorans]|uniref:hypothetical protein n=1 Tax=Fructilactobacillus fructivorans TaxID=1614 RepID=UPI000704E165|nr:hypothetical protein [Fructilactobacillus fructivorans]KRN13456.1 hypothetical protein IV37_GL000178 [Fructilactobacillus fructivorans]